MEGGMRGSRGRHDGVMRRETLDRFGPPGRRIGTGKREDRLGPSWVDRRNEKGEQWEGEPDRIKRGKR